MTTLYNSTSWAVEKQAVSASGNLTGPQLLSATSIDQNTVRLVFDRALMLEYRQGLPPGGYHAGTLDLSSYRITNLPETEVLTVIRTKIVSSTTIDLLTDNQQIKNYRVKALAGGVMDFWGNLNTLQQQTFMGQETADFLSPPTLHTFTSGYGGLQSDAQTDFFPDLDPPYLTGLNPAPDAENVLENTNVTIEILDDEDGVDPLSVYIEVDGAIAWTGDAAQPGFNVTKTAIAGGFRYVIDPDTNFETYKLIYVHVYAEDLGVIPNFVDDTYSFRVRDILAPTLSNTTPSGTDVSKTALIGFRVSDYPGSGTVLGTLNCEVGGVPAIAAGVAVAPFDGPSTSITANAFNGYDVVLDRTADHGSYELLEVVVQAEDAKGNFMDDSFSFRVEDYLGPLITAVEPLKNAIDYSTAGNITLEITDEQLVEPGFQVEIDRGEGAGFEVAYKHGESPAFKSGWNGDDSALTAIPGGYRLVIDPETDFATSTVVKVRTTADDPDGNDERLA